MGGQSSDCLLVFATCLYPTCCPPCNPIIILALNLIVFLILPLLSSICIAVSIYLTFIFLLMATLVSLHIQVSLV